MGLIPQQHRDSFLKGIYRRASEVENSPPPPAWDFEAEDLRSMAGVILEEGLDSEMRVDSRKVLGCDRLSLFRRIGL
jgi:hypothetical protein